MFHIVSRLAKTKLCIPRTKCDAYTLSWRNLGFAFAERDAKPMVHTHSGFAKLTFRIARTRCEMVHTPSGLAKPSLRIRSEAYGPHSFWVGEPYVLHSQNEMRIPIGLHSFWVGET
jgi:hypothetical protein